MNILFLNHKIIKCGVYQYGLRLSEIIKKSKNMNFIYKEVDSIDEYISLLTSLQNIKCIFYNFHSVTMSWLNYNNIQKTVKNIGIMHESNFYGFDLYIDIGNMNNYIPRPIFENTDELLLNYEPSTLNIKQFIEYTEKNSLIIGSFGFGFDNKGFDKIIRMVNEQYDNAIIIKIIMPSPHFDHPVSHFEKIKNACYSLNIKQNIKLMISRDFVETEDLLLFLKSNTINIFLYDKMYNRGLSSVIDYAISVKKPIGISDSDMFRHIYSDEICLYKKSIQYCIDNSQTYCENIYELNSNEKLINKIEEIIYQI